MYKIEMRRVWRGKKFLIAIGIGFVIAVGQYLQNVLPMVKYLAIDLEKGVYPHSVFNKWIGGEYYTLWPMLFYFILPVLASFAHGDSFYQDIQSGYIKNICTRVEKKTYLKAKFVAVYLSGMFVVMFPLILNLLLSAMTLPALAPQPSTGFFFLSDRNMGASLYLTHPWIYSILYILLDGIFGGFFACISLAGTRFVSGRFVVTILPFTVQMILYVAAMIEPSITPVSFLSPAQPAAANPWMIFAEIIIFAVGIYMFYYWKGKEDEFLA